MTDQKPIDPAKLSAWMVGYITSILSLPPEKVPTNARFDVYGLDSVEAVIMAGVMEEEFGMQVDPIELFEHPSIDQFVKSRTGGKTAAAAVQTVEA